MPLEYPLGEDPLAGPGRVGGKPLRIILEQLLDRGVNVGLEVGTAGMLWPRDRASCEHLLVDGQAVGGVSRRHLPHRRRHREHTAADERHEETVEQHDAQPFSKQVLPAAQRLDEHHVDPLAVDVAADAKAAQKNRHER